MKNRRKNPLRKRVIKDFLSEWKKYLVVGLFLTLMIGFVSAVYVANNSMTKALKDSYEDYKLESGHFELDRQADKTLIAGIESGEIANVKEYYLDKAKKELDEKFKDEFDEKFNEEFTTQVKDNLLAQGYSEKEVMQNLQIAVEQMKSSDEYTSSYKEAYDEAYEDAVGEMKEKIEAEYEKAEEKYKLNDPDFLKTPVKVYEQFFRNEEENQNLDGEKDGTIRVYIKSEEVNGASILEGEYPSSANEIAIDRMHADNSGIKVGDTIRVGGEEYKVTGLIAYVNYATLHEKNTDMIFDALKFDVGMLTKEGFDRLSSPIHYGYAWVYENKPDNIYNEKTNSENFLKALVTQAAVSDRSIEDYLPVYENQAVQFAPDDIGSDKAMCGVLLYILILVIGFIFAVTTINTMEKDASAIGTLRASGYSKGELIRHYISVPILVTLAASILGNILGYTILKNIVISMYYNSYSLPDYKTLWNADAFLKTTIVPLFIMLFVNLIVIANMMRHSPIQFLRHDFKKSKRKKAIRLPKWKFFSRFRLRVMLQNKVNYLILFLGVVFVAVMLALSVGMPDTLKYYQDHASEMMFSKYQYILKNYTDEDVKLIETANENAEKFSMKTLLRKSETLDEEISVYGILPGSDYVKIKDIDALKENEVYISSSFQEKYNVNPGDTVKLNEKYESQDYDFKVAGIYDSCLNISVFMSQDEYNKIFGQKKEAFTGYLSNEQLTDLNEDNIAMVVTKREITKMCDQMNHSMGSYMTYFSFLCIGLSAILMYLLTKIIIEKNENSISMTKILGYTNKEIASLYIYTTTIILIIIDLISIFLGRFLMDGLWKAMMMGYSGWYEYVISPIGYVKMFVFIFAGYLLVAYLDYRRIKKIPMDAALKNVE